MYQVFTYSKLYKEPQSDAALVLGAAVWQGKPSPVFEERIKHAIKLYTQGKVHTLIFTGGKGKNRLGILLMKLRD